MPVGGFYLDLPGFRQVPPGARESSRGVSWGAVQNLVAPGGVGQVGEVAGRGHGTRAYPGTSTDSGEIEIWADRGALGMPLWMGKEVTLILSDCLHMLDAVAKEPLGGAVTVL